MNLNGMIQLQFWPRRRSTGMSLSCGPGVSALQIAALPALPLSPAEAGTGSGGVGGRLGLLPCSLAAASLRLATGPGTASGSLI